nr:hypothetical protein [Tanacetum cinerariifolium]
MPKSPENDRYKTEEGYHAVPPSYTRTFMPHKPDLIFNDASNASETVDCDYYKKQMVQKPVWNNIMRVSHQNSMRMTHTHSNRNVVPTAVLTRSRLVSFSAARPVPTAVPQSTVKSSRTVKHVVNKAHSPIRRPINHRTSTKNSNFRKKVTTVKVNKVNDVQGIKGNAEKASANWGNPQQALKDKCVIDSGCSRHMTGNISFLLDFEEFNGGYVAFRRNPNGGKITGKGDLTCLFAKVTLDESNLWHVRLGHINFKTMNKLVKGNLVRGLLSNIFENNHTCVACQKGKQHRLLVLVTKSHNKTPYELLLGRSPSIGFMRPFRCPVTILNTLDPLGKFDGKADEGFLVGYSINSKAFRVFNRIGPKWLFDIDTLTKFMNYQPVVAGNQPNDNAGIKENLNAGKVIKDIVFAQQYVLLPLWSTGSKDPQNIDDDVADVSFDVKENENDDHVSTSGCDNAPVNVVGLNLTNNTNSFNTASPSDPAVSPNFRIVGKSSFVDPFRYPNDPDMPEVEDIVYLDDEEDVGVEDDLSNLETNISVSPFPTTRVYKDHPVTQIIGDLTSGPQIRSMTRMVKEQGGLHQINDEDFRTCMFACFLSQEDPKKVHQALKDSSWIEAMNKARLVTQGHTQEECIDYNEVFAPVAKIKVIRLFLAYASFVGFMVYQMDVKCAFLYGTIEEEVYVDDIIFGSTNKKLCKAFEKLMKDKFQMSYMGELTFFLRLQVNQKDDGIFISQNKYVAEILRKFSFTDVKSASTPIEIEKPLLKDLDGEDVMFIYTVKRIVTYLKDKLHLGFWYPRDSPFNLVAYSDSDYVGASFDRKSTIGGCQILGCRLISWQCKKQTVVVTTSTEAEYVAAASCCA